MRFGIALIVLSAAVLAAAPAPRMPMPADYSETATYRWLQKPVLQSCPLDSMESLENWKLGGEKGEMSLTRERSHDGGHSLRLRFRVRTPEDLPAKNQRNYGTAGVTRRFNGEDWTAFNRVSFWIYPNFPGWRVAIVRIFLQNDGKVKIPGGFYPVYHCAVLKNHAWNHVVWEFPDLPRDRVVGLEFQSRRQGHEPEAGDTLSFDLDQLELQRVEPDHVEGWDVWKGRIAFSHTGYLPGARKTAIASDLAAREFSLIDQSTGQSVLSKAVANVKTRIGQYQVLDFTEFNTPGRYVIRAGESLTRPFRIGSDVWEDSIWKAVNFFYTERCGFDIPGAHRVCHRDWLVVQGDRKIVANGGWHDAGDLSQGLVNTSEAVYAMFDLARNLRARGQSPALERALIDEAKWGLDWVLKTSFGDGHRLTWATMGLWTDGIQGTNDDVTAQAQNSSYENFHAAAAEAMAARALRASDAELADYSLRKAREDWRFAVDGFSAASTCRTAQVEVAATGIVASMELYHATGERRFADKALELAPLVLNSQQREFLPGLDPLITGFFYTSPEKTRLLNYLHRSHEQAPAVSMAQLCEAFPEHPDWLKWYSSVVLYAEYYQKAMAALTEPFAMLPNSIRKADEYLQAPENQRDAIRQQIANGFKVGTDYFVRAYPVQPQGAFRGNYGTMLSQAKGVSSAACLRRNPDLGRLAQEQLHWVVGRNPFAQSTMYGEGYDYAPQYSAMSGDLVGSLPVGIKSRENYDVPYWPVHNHPNYKEVWVHPVSRWLWVLADLIRIGAEELPGRQFSVSQSPISQDRISIRLTGDTAGDFALRSWNLAVEGSGTARRQAGAGAIEWTARIENRNAPWIAVVSPVNDLASRRELVGHAPARGRP